MSSNDEWRTKQLSRASFIKLKRKLHKMKYYMKQHFVIHLKDWKSRDNSDRVHTPSSSRQNSRSFQGHSFKIQDNFHGVLKMAGIISPAAGETVVKIIISQDFHFGMENTIT
jgi:hypothetical protein